MHEVIAADFVLQRPRNFIRKSSQDLILLKREFHLLVVEYLAKCGIFKQIDQYKCPLTQLHVIPVQLHLLPYLVDHLMVRVLARVQPHLVLPILISLIDVDNFQGDRQLPGILLRLIAQHHY